MSTLGHKQTFAVQKGMSALPPIADMCGATRYVRMPIVDMHVCFISALMASISSGPNEPLAISL